MTTRYITTPIYYVNDRPHIGHCYTTLLADVLARAARLADPAGGTFFLTGTDEHADKVVTSAADHHVTPIQWADRNAEEFKKAFAFMNTSHDDFIRTTQDRHISKVREYIRALQASGDIYLGDYVGWFDPSQEEYLTETTAKEHNYLSPVTGKPLVKKTEKNYFFKLSAYETRLREHIESTKDFIKPDARRNEVLGRLRQGLQDVPISRAVTDDPTSQWGIRMPDDAGHRIYVWIDALFNYLSVVDTPERAHLWPAQIHLIAKDILWFHAVIWPALLMALKRDLPRTVYAHSYWVREGRKMSKSLGNFVTLEVLQAYVAKYSLDAVRWYLVTQGPLRETDADFSHAKFVETYNAELANGIGNCTSRVGNMIARYFDGKMPAAATSGPHAGYDFAALTSTAVKTSLDASHGGDASTAVFQGIELVRHVDGYINTTAPFKLAKLVESDPSKKGELATILFNCAETLRIASLLLTPAMPTKIAELWSLWNCGPAAGVPLATLATFAGPHALKPGSGISKGDPLFMRADVAEAPPA
ncbi:MAG: methionine--tRNA ligase [Planctomycetota bacterium]|nr:methionine--tRNA ligase [Planctomycetota bacterium]